MYVNSEQSDSRKEQNSLNERFEETVKNTGPHNLSMGVKLLRSETFKTTRCTS